MGRRGAAWLPIGVILSSFGLFLWVARTPTEPTEAVAKTALPGTLEEAAIVWQPARPSTRVALLLHGSGSSAAKFADFAKAISEQGFVAVVVRGPRELGPGRYTWPSVAETHALLQRTLELARAEIDVVAERPIVIGYSAGATLAVDLLAEHPESYASAFAISPGPLAHEPLAPSTHGRPLVIMVGEEDGPSTKAVGGIERAWSAAHEPLWIMRHPGDHRPPSDWRARIDDALTWIAVKAS